MKKKKLIDTNPYLKDPTIREKLIVQSVISSSGVEGVKIDSAALNNDEAVKLVNIKSKKFRVWINPAS